MSGIDWSSLQHAYGSARNIPPLLEAARTSPVERSYDDEPWFTLRRNQPRAPGSPPALVDSYRRAIVEAGELAQEISGRRSLSENNERALAIIKAVFRGDYVLALRLLGEDEDVEPSPIGI